MSVKRLTIAALLATCTFVPRATAQKNELSGLIGRTFIADQGVPGATTPDNKLRSGNGLSLEGNYARHVMGGEFLSLSLEVPFVWNPDEDWHTQTNPTGNYSSYFVTPAARLNVFSGQAVSPWVSIGAGFGRFTKSSGTGTSSSSTGLFQVGLGLDVRIFERFSFRGEARDFWSGVPQLNINTGKSRQHNLFVGGGIVWHF